MKATRLAALRLIALFFLLPGLAGLIVSAVISTNYLDKLPKFPAPEEMRIIPRNIHGTVVYQTEEENRRLNLFEYSSTGVFVLGLGLGLVYLEQWGGIRARDAEEAELHPEETH